MTTKLSRTEWLDKPLVGKFPGELTNPPDSIRIRGARYIRTKGIARHGAELQYREDTPRNSAHLYVLPTGRYVIDHRDAVSPEHSVLRHFVADVLPSLPKLFAERRKTADMRLLAGLAEKIAEPEKMTPAKWRQAVPDVLAATTASALGYGISRTLAERYFENQARQGRPPIPPAMRKYLPIATAVGSGALAYGLNHLRKQLKERRELAEAEKTSELKPGDIIVAAPGRPEGLSAPITAAFNRVSKAVQGRYTHSGLYVGKGNVVEIVAGKGVLHRPVAEMLRGGREAVVVRPRVPVKDKRRAVASVLQAHKEQPQYDFEGLGRVLLASVAPMSRRKEEEMRRRVICSNLISNAYAGVSFHPKKDNDHLMPADFVTSDKVDVVGVKKAGVEPAPQSRGIPKRKPSDPWNYDPRPTFEL